MAKHDHSDDLNIPASAKVCPICLSTYLSVCVCVYTEDISVHQLYFCGCRRRIFQTRLFQCGLKAASQALKRCPLIAYQI